MNLYTDNKIYSMIAIYALSYSQSLPVIESQNIAHIPLTFELILLFVFFLINYYFKFKYFKTLFACYLFTLHKHTSL